MKQPVSALVPWAVALGAGAYAARQRVRRALAERDAVTGLRTRGAFFERADRAARRRRGLLLVIDLDQFKRVNDTYGHPAGDYVLWSVAQRLTARFGGSGVIGRLGGDEFAVFVEDPSLADGIAEALARPLTWNGQTLTITASVGVVQTGDGAAPVSAALAASDRSMYAIKSKRRDPSGALTLCASPV